MSVLLKRSPVAGIEIASGTVRAVVFSGKAAGRNILSAQETALSPGVSAGIYMLVNADDRASLAGSLTGCLTDASLRKPRRAAVSLPDQLFRVQTLEFDTLPAKTADRERLIRWRLEKTAAFDLSDTVLRCQVLRSSGSGFTVIACLAKKAVIARYEEVLMTVGLEPWWVGVSSFSTLNYYTPYITKKSNAFALVHVTHDSFTTIVCERHAARFYRFKDIKRGGAGEACSRLVREITDSLHFYSHRDRTQQTELRHLYLTGDPSVNKVLAGELRSDTGFIVETLSPEMILPGAGRTGVDLSAALGAGAAL